MSNLKNTKLRKALSTLLLTNTKEEIMGELSSMIDIKRNNKLEIKTVTTIKFNQGEEVECRRVREEENR